MANSLVTAGVEHTPAEPVSRGPAMDQPKDTRVCMYREGEARIFDAPEQIPPDEGWVDHPDKVKPRKEEKLHLPKTQKAKEQ